MTEEFIIKKLTTLLNTISDESGIMIQDISVSWMNLDNVEKEKKRVRDIKLQISADIKII